MKFRNEKFKAVSQLIKSNQRLVNWPFVYILYNKKNAYVGETGQFITRMGQHLANPNKKEFTDVYSFHDDDFNKSATLNIESKLIEYMSADNLFRITNGNQGQSNDEYYDKTFYESKFEDIWAHMMKSGLAQHDLRTLVNSDLFKYTPYKNLSNSQYSAANDITNQITLLDKNDEEGMFIVEGSAGTGKTVLALFLLKLLSDGYKFGIEEEVETKKYSVALVVPMSSLRKTLKSSVKNITGLSAGMIIGPSEAAKGTYDILIVDESHRLRRRKNLMPGHSKRFSEMNESLGLPDDGDELDWILRSSKYQIFFFDEKQSVRPSDIRPDKMLKVHSEHSNHYHYTLDSQMRVKGGSDYIQYVKDILSGEPSLRKLTFDNYEFVLFDSISDMVEEIMSKDNDQEFGLSRVVAGYSWKWVTKNDLPASKDNYDMEIQGNYYKWNSTSKNWINSDNAINEFGSIHTVQGYDLNYCGVVIGEDIYYDQIENRIKTSSKNYFDSSGKKSLETPHELAQYIKNIYSVLMTRGIHGTYLYIVDDSLRNYMKQYIKTYER